ncbi:MAG: CoA-binding protein [Syntrophales bacterium]|nr:CoA-binding protein [Syntrophales bacterium]
MEAQDVKFFFEPKSVAIVGASSTPGRPGYMIIENLLEWGFKGSVYPVNPTADEILGLKAYADLREIPASVELVISLTPAEETLEVIEQCREKGIRGIVIVSGGFSEINPRGTELEKEIVVRARQSGIRVMGPNVIGPINTSNNFVLSFYSPSRLKKGNIAFVAQSGQFCSPVMDWMASHLRLGVSKSIDLGNKCDLNEADILEYLENDVDSRAIALYIEGFKEGRRFLRVAERVSRKKPIIVFKTGRTSAGARATASHTGAMAGDDRIADALIRQVKLIRAKDLEEFLDLAKAFQYLSLPRGKRVGIITYSGGIAAMAADAATDWGLELATLSPQTVEQLGQLDPVIKPSNPLDLFTVAPPSRDLFELYRAATEVMLADNGVDCLLVCFMVSRRMWWSNLDLLARTAKISKKKPTVAWVIGDEDDVIEVTQVLEEDGMPVFPSPERAMRALGVLYTYQCLKA